MTTLEKLADIIRDNVHESEAVSDAMHEAASVRAARRVLEVLLITSEPIYAILADAFQIAITEGDGR